MAAKGGKTGGGQGFKGFGEAPKPPKKAERSLAFDPEEDQEASAAASQLGGGENDEEIPLMPAYQMYTDAGYKAQRVVGPLKIEKPEGKCSQLHAGFWFR